jgi:hypothetical protein
MAKGVFFLIRRACVSCYIWPLFKVGVALNHDGSVLATTDAGGATIAWCTRSLTILWKKKRPGTKQIPSTSLSVSIYQNLVCLEQSSW